MYLGREKGIFGKFVAVLGIIQSLGWLVLCIICIVFYYHPPARMPPTPSAYGQYLSKVITEQFITSTTSSSGDEYTRIITPKDFNAFMWIYVIASAIWLAASIDEYSAIKLNKARQGHTTLLLGILMLMISTVDLIFVSLLLRDLGHCKFDSKEVVTETTEILSNTECHIATEIVMTMAARGFVLWAINVVLGIGMIVAAAEVFKSRTPKILSYDNHTIPRVQIGKSDSPVAPSSLEKENPFFRGGMNPALYPTRPVTPNRNSTPIALTGRNNGNLYF